MTDITPADLAKFIHPVPVGATIPAGTEVMEFTRIHGHFRGPFRYTHTYAQLADDPPRWTAEPLAAPKPPLTERVREFASEVLNAPPVGFPSVVLDTENQQNRWIAEAASILAEIAERLDADR